MTLNKPASSIQRAWNNYRSLEPDGCPSASGRSWWVGLSRLEFTAVCPSEAERMAHSTFGCSLSPPILGGVLPMRNHPR